jgi:hypothetical protein
MIGEAFLPSLLTPFKEISRCSPVKKGQNIGFITGEAGLQRKYGTPGKNGLYKIILLIDLLYTAGGLTSE